MFHRRFFRWKFFLLLFLSRHFTASSTLQPFSHYTNPNVWPDAFSCKYTEKKFSDNKIVKAYNIYGCFDTVDVTVYISVLNAFLYKLVYLLKFDKLHAV